MRVKVAQLIANYWADNGIKDVFMVTGGGAMHLNDAIGHHPGIRCIFNHHEQACAIAAEGYARLCGNLAGVCVTSGPGGTNAITGVLGAWLDSIPMFVISGQVKRATTIWSTNLPLRQLGDQEFPIVSTVKTMTKYAVMVTEPEDILYHMQKAMFLCKNGRPGPVWLDIPLDVQGAIVETDDLRSYDDKEDSTELPPAIESDTIYEILKRIEDSKRPVILAGTGIRLSGGHDDFLAMVENLQIPVVTAWNAHDVIWNDHPLFCGRPGTVGTRGGNFVVQNSDLLIVLGCRLNIRQISYNWEDFAKYAYKIMIDIDKAELLKPTLSIDMKINADVKDVMKRLISVPIGSTNKQKHSQWLTWCREVDRKYPVIQPRYYDKPQPVNPYVFMDILFKILPENQNVITSNGSACVTSFQAAYIKRGQRLFTNSGCAGMGYGLPAAIGGYFASGERPIVCIEGDGSIQMNLQELQTVVHHNMDMKIIWLNNDGYHSIRQTQSNLFNGDYVGINLKSGISFPNADRIADAYGFAFVRVDNNDNIEKELEKALSMKGPVIIEVVLDSEQFFEPKLSSKVLPDGTIISPPLQDMYPFLDKGEYNDIMLVNYE